VLLCIAIVTLLTVFLWPDPTKATLETVAETDSKEFLFKIATRGPSEDIRIAAVKKLTDQSLLARVAMRSSCNVAMPAVLRVDQPELLEKIAIHGRPHWASYVAALKIRDQAALERIALASQHQVSAAYEFAVQSIVDFDIVRRVAKQARDRRVRAAAVRYLDEPKMIRDFILENGGDYRNVIYWDTLLYLDGHDEELRTIALEATDLSGRRVALGMLKNPKYVEEVLQKYPELRKGYKPKKRERIPRRKRIYPVAKITDRDELFRMAIHLPYSSLPIDRCSAAYRIAELNREEAIQKRAERAER
jgi:hypothetical protein